MPPNQEQQFNPYMPQYGQGMPMGMPQQNDFMMPEDYEKIDAVQGYGSIIKDLTDTQDILDQFEMRVRGKKRLQNGDIVDDKDLGAYIKTDKAAREFMSIIRSTVNRHNDFSYYNEEDAYSIIDGANEIICHWLMLQGEDVPTRYRRKLSFEAMSLISASMHKALEGKMLVWTKGTFREGVNINQNPNDKGNSVWNYIWPFGKKNNR